MPQQPVNFDPAAGDDTTAALRKLDNSRADLDTRLTATTETANTAKTTADSAKSTANAATPKTGGTFTGDVTVSSSSLIAQHAVGTSSVSVSAGASRAMQGLHLWWNTLGSGTADFQNNRGSGSGGWTFQTSNADNTAVIGTFGFSALGEWNVNQAFRPGSDNAANCGTSSQRWANIYAANGSIVTSDERTKVNIQDTTLGLAFILSLRPVQYQMAVQLNQVEKVVTGTETQIVDGVDDDGNPTKIEVEYPVIREKVTPLPGVRTHDGLLAQEVAAALQAAGVDPSTRSMWSLADPDDPNSRQALLYDEMLPPLIRAVQEQQGVITHLIDRIVALEAR